MLAIGIPFSKMIASLLVSKLVSAKVLIFPAQQQNGTLSRTGKNIFKYSCRTGDGHNRFTIELDDFQEERIGEFCLESAWKKLTFFLEISQVLKCIQVAGICIVPPAGLVSSAHLSMTIVHDVWNHTAKLM